MLPNILACFPAPENIYDQGRSVNLKYFFEGELARLNFGGEGYASKYLERKRQHLQLRKGIPLASSRERQHFRCLRSNHSSPELGRVQDVTHGMRTAYKLKDSFIFNVRGLEKLLSP